MPGSVMVEVDPRSLVRNKVLAMRFWGYVGVQFCAILVPMLVFRLSGSPALAGAALFMEWLPKLGLYMAGGSLVQRYSSLRAHLALDSARLAAMAALGASVAWSASVWIVAGAAAVYQCANAVSNILFERSVPRWWDAPEQAQGHAALMRSDQWACLAALCIGVLAKDPLYLALKQ